jgi:outer membrane protein assembly factor BamA
VIAKQNVYFALNAFTDVGTVVKKHPIDYSLASFAPKEDGMHYSYGGGLHIAMNANFVLAINYGIALDKQDGDSGLYFNASWLF